MVKYKGDIISRLKAIGYNTTRIRKENIFGQKTMQDFRTNAEIPYKTINKLCEMLHCQPGDILEFVPDTDKEQKPISIDRKSAMDPEFSEQRRIEDRKMIFAAFNNQQLDK